MGAGGERKRTSSENWRNPLKWNQEAQAAGVRARVFCASLADWLDNKVPNKWRDDLAELIEASPHLDWLLLTKRIKSFEKRAPWSRYNVPSNVWIGATCETQDWFDRRIRYLAPIGAVKFVSYEPALGPLKIGSAAIDRLICGGESGPGARAQAALGYVVAR